MNKNLKPIIYSCLLILIFGISVFAQKVKTEDLGLPSDISKWVGEDSGKILNNAIITTRLKKLLGEKDYESFIESFETLNMIEKQKNFLFSSGCMIHACTRLESAIAIDLDNKTIHAAIFNEIEKTKFFNEKNEKTPELLIKWAKNLENLNKDAETIVDLINLKSEKY